MKKPGKRKSDGRRSRKGSRAGFMLLLGPLVVISAVGALSFEYRRGEESVVRRTAHDLLTRYRDWQTEQLLDAVGRELRSLPEGTRTVQERQESLVRWIVHSPRGASRAIAATVEEALRRTARDQDVALWVRAAPDGHPRFELSSAEGFRVMVDVEPEPPPRERAAAPAPVRRIPGKTPTEFEEVSASHRAVTEPAPVLHPSVRPRCAVIIDDVGERASLLPLARTLEFPVTFAVLPGLGQTRQCASELAEEGREIMLHLPMEPQSYPLNDPGKLGIFRGMSDSEIETLTIRALREVPEARGVNNHMGSAATRDRGLMRRVLSVVKQRRLFFIDSRTAGDSVAYDVARELGIPSASRAVFLDTDRFERDFTRQQLRELVETARKRGVAIGIGHWHANTMEVIREELPALVGDDVDIVFAGELVTQP